jgi:pyruvate/2-oxoglutarate dehydrogenase complex dihydrolipoamide acyltransferase (E2) component
MTPLRNEMKVPILMPQLGESIAEATIVSILVSRDQDVLADQEIIEVETSKAVMGVTVPCPGKIVEISAVEGQSYAVGTTLGFLQTTEAEAAKAGLLPSGTPEGIQHIGISGNASDSRAANVSTDSRPLPQTGAPVEGTAAGLHFAVDDSALIQHRLQPIVEPTVGGLPVPAGAAGASYLSPRMRARMLELGMNAADLAGVAGSGAAGRVTVEDFEAFIAKLETHRMSPASPMRVAVADSMRRSCTRPLATVGRHVVLDAVLAHRRNAEPKPGPALYALRALAIALGEDSTPAGRLVGQRIVHPKAIDIGFAVEVEDGVLVPALRRADQQKLPALVAEYNRLVQAARERRLPRDAAVPGIATVTNFGTFGIDWATPIPLPEQNLVLGLGVGRKCPHFSEEVQQFIPVIEANLTLSFDHRVLDGGGAGRLLARVADLLQRPELL